MVEFALTELELALRDVTRQFSEETLRRAAGGRDFPVEVVRAASELGLRTVALSEEQGGVGADRVTLAVIAEELGRVDLGIAVLFERTWTASAVLERYGSGRQRDRHLGAFAADDGFLIGIAPIEEEAGVGDAAGVVAGADGDGYVLTGRSGLVVGAPQVALYLVGARVGEHAVPATFLVPADADLSFDRQQTAARWPVGQASLGLHGCRVGADARLGSAADDAAIRRDLTDASVGAAAAVGVAHAAYELAVSYGRLRVQGGQPIIQHEAIGATLAGMLARIETARLLAWRAAWEGEKCASPDPKLSHLAAAHAADAVQEVVMRAIEIHGGYGIMADLPLGGWLRDVATFAHLQAAPREHLVAVQQLLIAAR